MNVSRPPVHVSGTSSPLGSTPAPQPNLIEYGAQSLIRPKLAIGRIFERLSEAGLQTKAARKRAQSALIRSAADVVEAQTLADLEVATAEAKVRHDQMRSGLLLQHRRQNDELTEQADTQLIEGITQITEQKAGSLERLMKLNADPELLKLAANAVSQSYHANVQHLLTRRQQIQHQSDESG